MKSKLLFGTALLLSLMATACQDTVNTIENTNKTMNSNIVHDTRFHTDSFLKNRLALQSINTSRTQDGFMRAQLEAVNVRTGFFSELWSGLTGENPYKIRYKFVWFDRTGMAVNTTLLSDWQTAFVKPGETLYLQSV